MKPLLMVSLLVLLVACAGPAPNAGGSSYNQGVEAWRARNYAEARAQWTRSLAEGGPDEALNNLGYLLYHGLGGDAQPAKAVELWRKGASLGVSESQWHLGQAHESGRGAPLDLVQAYAWYLCAVNTASQAHEDRETEALVADDARRSAQALAPRLSAEQSALAHRKADELMARYSRRLQVVAPGG